MKIIEIINKIVYKPLKFSKLIRSKNTFNYFKKFFSFINNKIKLMQLVSS